MKGRDLRRGQTVGRVSQRPRSRSRRFPRHQPPRRSQRPAPPTATGAQPSPAQSRAAKQTPPGLGIQNPTAYISAILRDRFGGKQIIELSAPGIRVETIPIYSRARNRPPPPKTRLDCPPTSEHRRLPLSLQLLSVQPRTRKGRSGILPVLQRQQHPVMMPKLRFSRSMPNNWEKIPGRR